MKVLISEDQPQLQTIMESMMRKWGYDADITSNGLEAFNLAKKKQYDICIMDLKMPIMDGYEATYKIRAYSGRNLPPIPEITCRGFRE